jgi:CheY-like chemotaxis protein
MEEPPRTRRLVIADNDPEVLDLLVTDLTAEGHEILATELQGDAAIERCRELSPDVLITDHRMPPGPNGIEVATAAVALEQPPTVIIYTNYRDPSIRSRAEHLGVTVLAKGNLRALRRAIEASPSLSR